MTINNSYKTNLGCDGNTIKDNKFYVIINMTIKNLYDAKVELPYDEIYLRLTENEKVSPIDDYLEEFADFGYRFISRSRLEAQEEREAVLVYEVSNDYENNSFRLEYFDSKTNDNGKITYNYKKVTLTPQEFNEVETISEKKLGETLSLDNSFLTGTSIKIDEAEIANRFTYEYTLSNGNKVNKVISSTDESAYKKTILRLKVELITNDELYSKVYSNFYGNFAKIEYEIDGTIYHQKSKIINLTTTGSAYTYLEIENKAINANKVSLVFTIRDKEYKYLLIEKE